MRISDWSSDVCSSDLASPAPDSACAGPKPATSEVSGQYGSCSYTAEFGAWTGWSSECSATSNRTRSVQCRRSNGDIVPTSECSSRGVAITPTNETSARYGSCSYSRVNPASRSEEHTSELQSLMRISYAVFCLKKKN